MDKRRILYILFLSSGFSSLLYEVLWSRFLSLAFGATVYAITAVLSAYMLGLSLGSWVFGSYISRCKTPVRVYGLLEFGIGLYALITPFLFTSISKLHSLLLRNEISGTHSIFVRFFIAFVILVVPTFLMGGTLPAVSEYLVRRKTEMGRGVSTLYGLNTLGAVFGAFVTGIWLIGVIGMRNSLYLGVTLNLVIFFSIVFLFWKDRVERIGSEDVKQKRKSRVWKVPSKLLLFAYGLSGFVALAYEVVWSRILILYLFNGTYSFTIMLVSFLLGIGVGSLLIRKYVDRLKNSVFFFGVLEVMLGASSLVVYLTFFHLKDFMLFLQGAWGYNWWTIIGFALILSTLVMFLPTLVMGAIFPVATKAYRELRGGTTSLSVGWIYASNTMGTVLGSIAAGFVLIKFFGLLRTHLLLAILSILIGVVFIFLTVEKKRRSLYLVISLILILVCLYWIVGAENLRLHPVVSSPGQPEPTLLFYGEGPAATVTVFRYPGGQRSAYVNGTFIISDSYDALKTVKLLAHLPSILRDGPLDRALVVGFGMGVTTSELLFYPYREIDCVEIAPEVLKASFLFNDLNRGVYGDRRLNIIVEDGRNYVERTDKLYDVITVDPTHPVLGSGALYTLEFYQDCKKHLRPGGIFAEYLPLHLLSQHSFRSLLKTFMSVFPYTTLWMGQTHVIMVGSSREFSIPLEKMRKVFQDKGIKESLRLVDLGDPLSLMSHFISDWMRLKRIVEGGDINTDNRPFVEYIGPSAIRRENWPLNMKILLSAFGLPSYIEGDGESVKSFRDSLKAVLDARYVAYQGMVAYGFNNFVESLKLFMKARDMNPSDPVIRRLLKIAQRRI